MANVDQDLFFLGQVLFILRNTYVSKYVRFEKGVHETVNSLQCGQN
jgi:hypothetical protein